MSNNINKNQGAQQNQQQRPGTPNAQRPDATNTQRPGASNLGQQQKGGFAGTKTTDKSTHDKNR